MNGFSSNNTACSKERGQRSHRKFTILDLVYIKKRGYYSHVSGLQQTGETTVSERRTVPRRCRKIIGVHLFNEVVSDIFLCTRIFFMINSLAV